MTVKLGYVVTALLKPGKRVKVYEQALAIRIGYCIGFTISIDIVLPNVTEGKKNWTWWNFQVETYIFMIIST